MEKLKPCPFCGGKAKLRNMFGMVCGFDCECGAIVSFQGNEKKDDAIAAWNKRAGKEVAENEII